MEDGSSERGVAGIAATPGYCAFCGREASGQFRRLGEAFCSEAHAVEFAREVRALAEGIGR